MDNMTAEQALGFLLSSIRCGDEFGTEHESAASKIRTALSAPRVPEGWALVPVEPTEDMITESLDLGAIDEDDVVRVWNECIAAAPKPPATTNDETARLREGGEL